MSKSIMVGYDGSEHSKVAAEYAAAEAQARQCELHIICANPAPVMAVPRDPGMYIPGETDSEGLDAMMAEARTHAHQIAADVPVHTEIIDTGTPAGTLIDQSWHHALAVLGSRGRGGFSSLLLGSVSSKVASHAHCTVVVTRPRAADGPHTDAVVVGVDGSEHSQTLLAFAFATAARRGWKVLAVYAWQGTIPTGPGGAAPIDSSYEDLADQSTAILLEALNPWRSRYPDTTVEYTAERGDPRKVLAELGRGCQLLAVGTHGMGNIVGTVLGTVSHSLLHHAESPVAIVRPPSSE